MKREMEKTEKRYAIIARYNVERMAVYGNSSTSTGAEKVATIYRDNKFNTTAIQIGNGKMNTFSRYKDGMGEFWFGAMSPQRWAVLNKIEGGRK